VAFKNRIVGLIEMSPKELKANPKNWRVHPKRQMEGLQGVLSDVGWVDTIMFNEVTEHIVDGHARVELAIREKEEKVPVLIVHLTQEEEEEVLATFDPTSAMAHTNREKLAAILLNLRSGDERVNKLKEAIARTHKLISPAPKFNEPGTVISTDVKRGDVFYVGTHKVMCGSATSEEDVETLIADDEVALTLTDPPYNVNYPYNSYKDNLTPDEYSAFVKAFVTLALSVSPAVIVTVGKKNEKYYYRQFDIEDSTYWNKGYSNTNGIWTKVMLLEPILMLGEKPKGKFLPTDYFDYHTDRFDGLRDKHSCPKPVPLWKDIIMAYTDIGDAVYDGFGGSGTTAVVCENTGRLSYTMEIDPVYCELILQRVESMVGKKRDKV